MRIEEGSVDIPDLPRSNRGVIVAGVSLIVIALAVGIGLVAFNEANRRNIDIAYNAKDAGRALGGLAGLVLIVAIVLAPLVINLLVGIWIFRDANSRGDNSGLFWMLLAVSLPVLGMILYLIAREKGMLVKCGECGKPKLAKSTICPHCTD